jgi:hypothetical protein
LRRETHEVKNRLNSALEFIENNQINLSKPNWAKLKLKLEGELMQAMDKGKKKITKIK